ncbi:hypothetical protein [Cerasicoccus frondis]|nr:hypothetical protein [Cerasicoccus frondis]
MKSLAVLFFVCAFCVVGCEQQKTVTVNDGFGMEFTEDSNANQAEVID